MAGLIRMAEPEDLLALEQIENDADALFIERFQPDHWWPASTGAARAATPGFILVMTDEADAVVGFVHVVEPGGVVHLEQLSVAPSQARKGCGRALVEAAKTESARRGYRAMTLRTYDDVPWNGPFYAKLGFRPSEPSTRFHRRLLEVEAGLELSRYGHRIQMTAQLLS